MDCAFVLWLFAVSVVASAFGGMLGMASGIFIVPILTVFGRLDIHRRLAQASFPLSHARAAEQRRFLRTA
jgi:uncharacterized membrane protein YfcA